MTRAELMKNNAMHSKTPHQGGDYDIWYSCRLKYDPAKTKQVPLDRIKAIEDADAQKKWLEKNSKLVGRWVQVKSSSSPIVLKITQNVSVTNTAKEMNQSSDSPVRKKTMKDMILDYMEEKDENDNATNAYGLDTEQ